MSKDMFSIITPNKKVNLFAETEKMGGERLCISSVIACQVPDSSHVADDPQEIVFGMARERGAAEIINERTNGWVGKGRENTGERSAGL